MTLYKLQAPSEKKLAAVQTYLTSGQSLRTIAHRLKLPFTTLNFWVRRYQTQGAAGFKNHRFGRRRIARNVETKVMHLKEQIPSLTIRQAQDILKRQRMILSHQGIWHIWKKYGLVRRSVDFPIDPFCEPTPDIADDIEKAKESVNAGAFKEAAAILNALPRITPEPLFKKIPLKFLTARRKLDLCVFQYGEISVFQFGKQMNRIGRSLEQEGLIYSSLFANFWELNALEWQAKPEKRLILLRHLHKKMLYLRNNMLWFLYYAALAQTCCELLHIKQAQSHVEECRRLAYRIAVPYCWQYFGSLLSYLGKEREAGFFFRKALLHETDPGTIVQLTLWVASFVYNTAGEYTEGRKLLTKAERTKNLDSTYAYLLPHFSLCRAFIAYGKGQLAEASRFFLESLAQASDKELHVYIHNVALQLSVVYMALDKHREAKAQLRKYIPLMRKKRDSKSIMRTAQLLYPDRALPKELLLMPDKRMFELLRQANKTLRIKDYRKAFEFAKRKRMLGLFHRRIVFFPRIVVRLLEKGKPTGLPKSILKFPVFNKKIPIYEIRIMGDPIIYKSQDYLKTKLSPKQMAFVIHLALKAGVPGRFILLDELYRNYWDGSPKPGDRLLHILTSIKKKLRMPSHLVSMSSVYPVPKLINRGIYFTTDYDQFETLLAQVKSLERAEEWTYARRDYLRAFKLLRGEPFRKMYDPWSEQMRAVILNKVNETLKSFIQGCIKHNNKKDAQRVVTRIATFLPMSEEVQNLMKDMAH